MNDVLTLLVFYEDTEGIWRYANPPAKYALKCKAYAQELGRGMKAELHYLLAGKGHPPLITQQKAIAEEIEAEKDKERKAE